MLTLLSAAAAAAAAAIKLSDRDKKHCKEERCS